MQQIDREESERSYFVLVHSSSNDATGKSSRRNGVNRRQIEREERGNWRIGASVADKQLCFQAIQGESEI